jgi:hypothetical protein
VILYIAENAQEATARQHPEIVKGTNRGQDMANWFVVQGGTSIVDTEITLAMAVNSLLGADRLVYRIDTDGGHLERVTEPLRP